MAALGFSNEVIGLFNSLPAIALLLVGIPFSAFADRIGYRVFLLGRRTVAVLASLVLTLVVSRLIPVLAAGPFALAVIALQVLASPLLAQVCRDAGRSALF